MNSEKRWIGRWIGVNYRMDFLLLDTVTEREREERERRERDLSLCCGHSYGAEPQRTTKKISNQ
jgi:hypothetical protein